MKEQHKAFADYYIETQNGADSYRRAYPNCKSDGTARTNANKLLTRTDVQAYVKERLASKEAERIATQDEILEFLTSVMRGEVLDQMGFETSVRDRKDAAVQLGKRHGMWVEKHEHSGELNVIKVTLPKGPDDDGD